MFYLPETFLVDVGEIDDQHMEMVDIANNLEQLLNTGRSEEFEEPFRQFLSLMRIHFAYEEVLMRNMDYPHFEMHRQHHHEVEARAKYLIEKCRENGAVTKELIVESFTNILSDIVHADLSFAEFAKQKHDPDPPETSPAHPG